MRKLTHKKFSDEINKKIRWVVKMFCEWRLQRNVKESDNNVSCDLDNISTVTKENIVSDMCRFLTEIKKRNGADFPGKTLYDIVICVQFHLETNGISWKLLGQDIFSDIRFTLDNLMKQRCEQGIGVRVCQAEILTQFHKEIFWSMGLLGTNDPSTLLNSVVFMLGKGLALRAGKEHRALKCPQFSDQLSFLHDKEGVVFVRYHEGSGFKTNKGGLKHHKVEPKTVHMYAIEDIDRCPIRLLLIYLSKLPKERFCETLYLEPCSKFSPDSWYFDRPLEAKKLSETVKDMCIKAGFPGFLDQHPQLSYIVANSMKS